MCWRREPERWVSTPASAPSTPPGSTSFGQLRADHYAFLIAQQHRIRFGGPARVAEGGRPETMIIVVEAETLADAEAWIATEPYKAHGGFSSVAVRPWSQVLPEPEPGALRHTLDEERAKAGAP